jgi:PAS domain S-box-containing protein
MRDGRQTTPPTTPARVGLAPAVLAIAVFLLATGCILFTRETGRVAALWPTNAAILAAILLAPPAAWRRYLFAGLAGTLTANLLVGDPLTMAAALAVCNGVEVGLCALVIRRLAGADLDLTRQRHLIVFLVASVAAPTVSGAGAALVLAIGRNAPVAASFRGWFAADALGLLIVTPALLALTPQSLRALGRELRSRRGWEAAIVLALTLAAAFGQTQFSAYFFIPPALVLVAFRLGVSGAALALLITALTGAATTLLGQGGPAFIHRGMSERLDMLQVFMATLTISVFPIATALAKRRRMEVDLIEANRRSHLAAQIGGVGYWRNDLITGEWMWSDETYAIHGMPRDPETLRRPLGIGLYHPDDQAKIRDSLRQVSASGEAFEIKLHFNRADDAQERIVVLKGEGERDSRGKVLAVFGVIRDITEEETSRGRIEASEQRFRLLADSSTDIVVKVNMADIIEYISPAIRRYGYDPRALIGVRRSTLVHPDDEMRLRGIRETLFATDLLDPALDRSYRMKTADGRYIWMEGNPTLIRDPSGVPIALISQLRDVNERRLAVDALAESEARYRIIAENVTDIVSRTTADGQIVYLSPSLKDVLGYDPDTLLGQSIVPYVHPDDMQANLPIYQQIITGERTGKTGMIYRLLHQDGHWVWVESNPILIRDRDGAPSELIDVARDVSARVQVELELRAARDSAEEAAKVKSAFLANMSHEIRTPLTAILGFTDLLADQQDLSAMARGRVERVAGAGQALLSIVNDVLDFSKLEAGHFEITAHPVSPERVLREALLMFSPQAEAKGLSLDFTAENLPAGLSMDPDRVRQILLNLIGNAIKFTDKGSIHLTAAYDAARERLMVSITDTGAGMSKAQQTKLFQRFSQVDASLTRRHGGTGLGLAICKGLTEAMGGEIRVTSEPGAGSTFHFHIAAPLAEMPLATDDGAQVAAPLAGLRVLVVDDNAVNRELARAVLEPFGAEVFDAEDGVAGVAAALSQPVDVILMDIRMPGLDGPAALKEIRAAEGPNRETPILAFTADADLGRLENELGFDGIVRKPIVATALAEAIYEAANLQAIDPADDLNAAAAS